MDKIKIPDPKEIVIERFQDRRPDTQDEKSMVMAAIQRGLAPELIEKMMELSERNEKNEARKAYYGAVARFKETAPIVKKDKYNEWLKCFYTTLGNLLDTYNEPLGKEGLSISFLPPEQTETTLTVECRLSHSLGHSESVKMTGPIDKAAIGKSGKASRTPMQDLRSTFTYLRATTCEAILGVSGTEATADDDGNLTRDIGQITPEQIKKTKQMSKALIDAKSIKDETDYKSRIQRLFDKDSVENLTTIEGDTLIAKLDVMLKGVPRGSG